MPNINGYEIVRRFDGSYAVYDYCWWPDPVLDNNPELNQLWLDMTGGWRAKGWIVVHVAPTFGRAVRWIHGLPDDPTYDIR
jgi:hypothetical protein